MHFLIDPSFPHSLPRIALKNPNLYLKWTHIENDQGLLCLGSTLPFRNDDIALLAQETIREAFNYIKEGIESNSHQDFTEDLLTYWAREEKKSPRSISLLSKLNECHAIEVFNFNNHYYFVDDQDQLVSWLKNKHASSIHLSQSINSHLFCITQKLVPAKFPSTIVQLIDLLAEEGISYKVILEKKIKAFIESKVSKELPILLSFQYTDNWILVGCLIKKNSGKINGFRDESKHKIILKNPSYFQRIVPDRADYAWIHKRNDLNIENLSQKSIAILGCGSLGSGIAKLLLQAGLKQLTLVDPETLSWGNISRHELGANDVGYSKVKGMERHLGSFYPYAEIQAVPSSWEEIDDKNNFFDKNDLVISTIGNWASERALNKYAINNNVRIPIIYSWLESHACVGHSVVIHPGNENSCFTCGFDNEGHSKYAVSTFSSKNNLVKELGCGNSFQPYGSVQVNPIHSLAAELTIDVLLGKEQRNAHRIWVGPEQYIEEYQGELTKFGRKIRHMDSNIRSFVYEQLWLKDNACQNH